MAQKISQVERPSEREIRFSRLLDATPERVWSMWSDVRHLHKWWGPTDFTTTTYEFDFVVGGSWRHVMHGPDGTDYPTSIVYREIEPPSRIVYEHRWDYADTPLEFTVVVTIAPEDGLTRLSFAFLFRDDEAVRVAVERYGVIDGGTKTLDRFAAEIGD